MSHLLGAKSHIVEVNASIQCLDTAVSTFLKAGDTFSATSTSIAFTRYAWARTYVEHGFNGRRAGKNNLQCRIW
jgi:hypothetical protein